MIKKTWKNPKLVSLNSKVNGSTPCIVGSAVIGTCQEGAAAPATCLSNGHSALSACDAVGLSFGSGNEV